MNNHEYVNKPICFYTLIIIGDTMSIVLCLMLLLSIDVDHKLRYEKITI